MRGGVRGSWFSVLFTDGSRRDAETQRNDVLPIPIRLELGGGRSGTLVLNLDEREKTFEQPLPSAPASVTINPDFGLLLYTTKK